MLFVVKMHITWVGPRQQCLQAVINRKQLQKFLDYLITQESMDKYGLEGVSYEMVDGKIRNNTLDNTLENTDAVGMALVQRLHFPEIQDE